MILLRSLSVPAFKHLRDVELAFPRAGSVLIEGPNESGKSTLFEAIYFALYGAALSNLSKRAACADAGGEPGGAVASRFDTTQRYRGLGGADAAHRRQRVGDSSHPHPSANGRRPRMPRLPRSRRRRG